MEPGKSADVDPDESEAPLVLSVDVGTSSVRALVYDRAGRAVRGWGVHRQYAVTTTPDGGVVADADELFELCVGCIDGVLPVMQTSNVRPDVIACDTFWHSLVGLNGCGAPQTPVMTWADTRSDRAAEELRRRLDVRAVRARTGTELHSSYWPAKLLWLSRKDPETFRKVRSWVSFGEYLYLRLFGERRVSVSMASGTGLFNQSSCDWDRELISDLPIQPDQLSPVREFSATFSDLREPYGSRWPALHGSPWYLAIGDGAANNVGSGGTGPERVVVMVGTSGALRVVRETAEFQNPHGLWTYRVDRRRIIQGGALSAGGNVFAWALSTLAVGDTGALMAEVEAMAPDSHGLTILPFLAGERSPDWNDNARAAIEGLTLNTRPAALVRALLEAITYRFGLVHDIIEREIESVQQVIGSGAALVRSPFLNQLLADVIGRPVAMSAVREATSRGAALMALEDLGAIDDIGHVDAPLGTIFAPRAANVEAYRAGLRRQQELYKRLLV
jgi:gluconokinase